MLWAVANRAGHCQSQPSGSHTQLLPVETSAQRAQASGCQLAGLASAARRVATPPLSSRATRNGVATATASEAPNTIQHHSRQL